jgi:choline kinase
MKPKKAIILVAGMGTRLKPLTDNIPKCLIEINKKPILVNALEKLALGGTKEVILVVGYLQEKIKAAIGDRFSGMKISYVLNDRYNQTNTSYSLWLAVKDLMEDILILEGDIFFENRLLEDFLGDKRQNLTAVEKYNPNLDGTFVEIGADQKVFKWIHKKDRPINFQLEDKYKTVNIHKFNSDFVCNILKPELKRQANYGGKEPIETVFKNILQQGAEIFAFDVGNRKWFEVDEAEEIKIAEEIFK